MSESAITGPDGRTLRVISDMIRIDYLSDINADWKFTDAAGHEHHCDYDAADRYPTLREVWDGTWWCDDCRDEHEDTHLECRQCGEHIRPGMTGPGTKWVPGLTECLIDGEPVTPEQAREFIERMRP
jgi:hypothetical protein